nr:MAG TPA: hypothetical protein [Caudoviricetes sp.]
MCAQDSVSLLPYKITFLLHIMRLEHLHYT